MHRKTKSLSLPVSRLTSRYTLPHSSNLVVIFFLPFSFVCQRRENPACHFFRLGPFQTAPEFYGHCTSTGSPSPYCHQSLLLPRPAAKGSQVVRQAGFSVYDRFPPCNLRRALICFLIAAASDRDAPTNDSRNSAILRFVSSRLSTIKLLFVCDTFSIRPFPRVSLPVASSWRRVDSRAKSIKEVLPGCTSPHYRAVSAWPSILDNSRSDRHLFHFGGQTGKLTRKNKLA